LPAHFHYRASYLYLLRLDQAEIEEEFRRRLPRSATSSRDSLEPEEAVSLAKGPGSVAVLSRQTGTPPASHMPFDLWQMSGKRTIEHRGTGLELSIHSGVERVYLTLPREISHADPIAFVVPCGKPFRKAARAAARANAALSGQRMTHGCAWRPPPQRLLLMRALIALDAHLEGASYRQTAEAVFGIRAVLDRWGSDTSLKEQTRYLVRKGRALMTRGLDAM
jgi:hypothetical protein